MDVLSTISNPFHSRLAFSCHSSSSNPKLGHIYLPNSVLNQGKISSSRISLPISLKSPCSSLNLKRPSTLYNSLNVNGAESFEEKRIPIEKSLTFPTVFDINEIHEILPHRYPFLLVDRVIEYDPGVSVVGIKHLTTNDSFFLGHFPGNPIMPGVLITEAMAQVSCLLLMQPEVGFLRGHVLFLGMDKVRFRRVVTVGDTLVMRLTLMKIQKGFALAKLDGKAYVGGELACEGELSLKGKLGTHN